MNWGRALFGMLMALPIIALLAYGLTRDASSLGSPLSGREAPAFALPALAAPDTVRLEDLRGQVVVLNFWASWCLACRDEHADLSTAASTYADRGVRFFGVLYSDTPEKGTAWIQEMGGQSYPALLDAGSRTAIGYGLRGVPETFIIDRHGTIVHKQFGPVTLARLSALIEPLLPLAAARDTAAEGL